MGQAVDCDTPTGVTSPFKEMMSLLLWEDRERRALGIGWYLRNPKVEGPNSTNLFKMRNIVT